MEMGDLLLRTVTTAEKTCYTENELVLPALSLIAQYSQGVNTTDLIGGLTRLLRPRGYDSRVLHGRQDTHFSQKVRNLKSHNKLTRLGVAVYSGGGVWTLTDMGRTFVQANQAALVELIRQGFSRHTMQGSHRIDYSHLVIEEGGLHAATGVQRERSERLKRYAVEAFLAANGQLACEACQFDFERGYDRVGQGFIELHHLRPLYLSPRCGTKQTLAAAASAARLVCANCHRVLHRRQDVLDWQVLVASVRFQVAYSPTARAVGIE